MGSHSVPVTSQPLKVLSLDGGGIRGLSSLLILEKIAEHIQNTEGFNETQKPCDMFDLIGGTGTGGIIAIMLGRLKMTLHQSIQAYKSLAETVLSPEPTNLSTYSPEGRLALIETAIKRMIRENCGETKCVEQRLRGSPTADTCPHEDTLFRDQHCTKTAVLAMTKVDVETSPTVISTYDTSASFAECKIWEIAMAISEPNNLISIRIGRDEDQLIDTRYGYNNPCEVLIAEAEKEFPGREMIILSIGTGLGDVVEISDSKSSVFRAYSKVATTSEQVDLRLRGKHSSTGGYYRFNVENGLEDVALLDSHKPSYIAGHTRNYLGENKHLFEHFGRVFVSGTLLPLLKPSKQKVHLDDDDNKCLSDLYVTDPSIDKKNIEVRNGGLLKDCYKWIIEHADFKRFITDSESRALWIKGDPGKGKTMLLCGIIDELQLDPSLSLSYFFCQVTRGNQINTATSVLRGLMYHLALHNPQLMRHLRPKYDLKGKAIFNNHNSWHELCHIMTSMLNDPTLKNVLLIVDALDECSVDREHLLKFISTTLPAKWIVSSRNSPGIEEVLNDAEGKVKIHLEVNQSSVSAAVQSYISLKVDVLAQKKKYDSNLKAAVLKHLHSNADSTFLWVALVCQELSNPMTRRWETMAKLESFPPGLDALYGRMLQQIYESKDAELCEQILATALVVYQSVTLEELHALVEVLEDFKREKVKEVISLCGSFLAIHGNVVSFVHQSAKDYLLNEPSTKILRSGIPHQHHIVFARSLKLLHVTLRRDIYGLRAPGCLINEVHGVEPDPLAGIRYCCIFWANHLHDSLRDEMFSRNDELLVFFTEKYLQWLEALSLLRNISAGVKALQTLEVDLQGKGTQRLQDIVKDAHRFLLSCVGIIEMAPLQVYASALIFSPTNSLIRQQFTCQEPNWVEIKPKVERDWNVCVQTLEGHNAAVTSVVFSNDGQRLASGSSDQIVKIWDATSGTCLRTLEGHNRTVTSVVFSNDGQRLASSSWDKTVKIWNVTFGTCLHTLHGHKYYVESVVFSNDGQRLASGSRDATVKIWDAISGTCLQTVHGHHDWVTSVVFSHDGQWLASGSRDKTIKIWDATSGKCLHTLEGHDNEVTSVVLALDGQRLASGSRDNTVKIWDATSGTGLHTLYGHDDRVTSVVFSHDGQRLASGSDDKKVKIWDATSATCLHTLEGHDDRVTSVVFSHDRQRLASGSHDKTVKIWDATSGTCPQTLGGHDYDVRRMVFSSDGQRLASGSSDEMVKIWDATSGTCLHTLNGYNGEVASVVFSNDGQRLASGSRDSTVKIWDATSGTCLHTLEGHDDRVTSVVFSNDGQRLASASNDKTVRIWNSTSGTCLRTLEGHNHTVTLVVFSNDGQRLASGSWDKTVKIWNVTSGTCLHTLHGHKYYVESVVFSNDGQRVASGSRDETAKIWDATSGTCLQTLYGHEDWVTSVVFSHDRQWLASGSHDKTVKIWDATSATCLHTLHGHDDRVTSVVFSHDRQRLASGSHDKTVKIWNASSGTCLHTLYGHDDRVTSVVFSHDRKWLASGSHDKTVKIWDVTSGLCQNTNLLGQNITFSLNPFGHFRFSFNVGLLDLDLLTPSHIPPTNQAFSLDSNLAKYSFSVDRSWIMKDEQRMLWLPPSYRPTGLEQSKDMVVDGMRIALCSPSKRIFILGFRSID